MADGWVEEVAFRAKKMDRGDLFQSTLLHDIHSWLQDNQDCTNPVIVKAITNIRTTAAEHIVNRMQELAGDCRAEVMTLLCDVSTLHETIVCDGEHKTCAHMKVSVPCVLCRCPCPVAGSAVQRRQQAVPLIASCM